VALKTIALMLLPLLLAGSAQAQTEVPAADAGVAAEALTPPVALEMPPIAYPADGPPFTGLLEVTVRITIDTEGMVSEATIERSGGDAADRAVLEGVKQFRFKPATQGGLPVAVRLPFNQTFVPPPPPLEAQNPALDAVLEGVAVELGTRAPVKDATVVVTGKDGEILGRTDASGFFKLAVRSGESLTVRVASDDHEKFVQREQLAPGEQLKVKYLLRRKSYGQYETIVRADRVRTEVSRTTLSGRELTRVPGTFGDPFKVVSALPGVSSVMSLLPLPIVRGSSPGNTGVLLDGVRLPLLFHLFGGPSVIHPELIDRVDFYPGGFPVNYGGYTGGIIDGITRPGGADEHHVELDLNLAQTGAFVREPIEPLGSTVTAAARVGYPGLLLHLLTPLVTLSYWDYQARLDRGSGSNRFTVFFFGAEDVLRTRALVTDNFATVARFTFHRLDLRYRHGDEDSNELYRVVLGFDDTFIGGAGATGISGGSATGNGSWSVNPRFTLHRTPTSWLQLNAGAESTVSSVSNPSTAPANPNAAATTAAALTNPSGTLTTAGVYVEAVWSPIERLKIIPGLRGDLYAENRKPKGVTQTDLDPRLLVRLKLTDGELGGTTLKGVIGRYHQPPRLFVPVPALDQSSLELGLLGSTQTSVGAETRLGPSGSLDVNAYYNDNNPVLFDLAFNPTALDVQQPQPAYPPWQQPPPTQGGANATLQNLFARRVGRAYGLEFLLRRQDTDGLFGWISYTLSRSERRTSDGTWAPFDFDRMHILNFVAGVRLPRNWEVGGRVLLQSGTPLTTIFGSNVARSDGQFRLDLRIDKRAVWKSWLLDFYVDIINSTVAEESGGLVGGAPIRYLIPTVGFRGVL
jgi:TonB family protein